ncbi:MAG: hypothetical protein GC168_17365 [Candidatus Hydrogenedens sp.]|nr:hypothetical protein [Candidatus Hydrogenedens sp.]
MINSPFVLYWALIAFVAFFVYDACRTRGDASAPARARAFTAAVLAMVAFLPVRMDEVIEYFRIMPAEQRNLLLGVVSLKSLAWLYLFGLVLRYYSGDPQVFVRLPTFLPSVRGTMRQEAPEAGRDARPPEPPEGVGKGLS